MEFELSRGVGTDTGPCRGSYETTRSSTSVCPSLDGPPGGVAGGTCAYVPEARSLLAKAGVAGGTCTYVPEARSLLGRILAKAGVRWGRVALLSMISHFLLDDTIDCLSTVLSCLVVVFVCLLLLLKQTRP